MLEEAVKLLSRDEMIKVKHERLQRISDHSTDKVLKRNYARFSLNSWWCQSKMCDAVAVSTFRRGVYM